MIIFWNKKHGGRSKTSPSAKTEESACEGKNPKYPVSKSGRKAKSLRQDFFFFEHFKLLTYLVYISNSAEIHINK